MEPDILKRMESFDFVSPVYVELFFEDSNDKVTEERNEEIFVIGSVNKKITVTKTSLNESVCSNTPEANKNIISDNNKISEINRNNNKPKQMYNSIKNNTTDRPRASNDHSNYDRDHNHISVNKEPTESRNSMLKMVSDYLLFIMKTYNVYQKKINNNKDKQFVDKCWNKFIQVKRHVYTLLYSTNVTVLLSQDGNANFMYRFLNYTLNSANYKKISCTYRQLESIYKEMLTWTKNKQKDLNNCSIAQANANKVQTIDSQYKSLSVSNLVTEYNNSQDMNNATSNIQNNIPAVPESTETCIFSSGLPGREVTINVNKSLLIDKNGFPSRLNGVNGNRITKNFNNNNYPRITDKNASSYPHLLSQLNENVLTPTMEHCTYLSGLQNVQIVSQQMQEISQMPQSYNGNSPILTANTNINPYLQCNYLHRPSKDLRMSTQMNCQDNYIHQTSYNGPNQAYSRISPHDMSGKPLPVHWSQLSAADAQSTFIQNNNMENARSRSTDSGFMSPVDESMLNDILEELRTRPISHVTSLNGNVSCINPT